MSYNQGTQLTLERSTYPKSQLFKPVTLKDVTKPTPVFNEFVKLLEQPVLPTAEENAWARRRGYRPSSMLHNSFDGKPDDWEQIGIYWVRKNAGSHPQCITPDRKGAHALWRNAEGCYSGDGFPTFYPETMKRFSREMEMIKPVLSCPNFPGRLLISLQRSLAGPAGNIWGIHTDITSWRIECGDTVEVIPRSKAALKRTLKQLFIK
jgi:hypothetical protein